MLIKILLVIAILIQTVATAYALKLVRATKYNSVWILFIVGFSLLSVERFVQLLMASGQYVPRWWFAYLGIVISICLSIGVMYAHKLFKYIGRLNRQRQLLNKRILTAVLRTEEKARSRFSKELHDGLGPLLSSARMSLSALARDERSPEQKEIIDNTTYVIDEAIRSLREISNNLSPHVLNDFGLARGVQNFIDKSAAMHDVKIRFTTNLRSERFDTDVEVILYRVICELINNSLKHAACSSINLSLSQNGTELALDYTDDGRGFNPQAMMDCGMGFRTSRRASIRWAACSTSPVPKAGGCAPRSVSIRRRSRHRRGFAAANATDMERTIVLVDDHSLFRNGLRGLLEHCAGCRVVGEAASGEEFLAMLPELEADIVFMDFAMPGIDGAQATERALARRPELRIITLSMFGEESYYTRMVQAGARGFLLKDSDIGDVVEAIDTVMAGGSYFSPQLLSSLAGRLRTREDAPDEELSAREREILVAVCRGLSNQEIADELFISKRTVDKHRANILEKTGCKNTASLVVYAIRKGIVEI